MHEPIFDPADPRLLAEYERAREVAFSRRDVTGVDIGYRYEPDGTMTEELVVRVHRKPKQPKDGRPASNRRGVALRGFRCAVPLERCHAVYSRHGGDVDREALADPLQPGIQLAHFQNAGGTLGLIVFDPATKEKFILSCAHVLRGPGKAPDGAIIQPIFANGGRRETDTIAQLVKSFDDIDGDAAIGRISTTRRIERAQIGTNPVVLIEEHGPVKQGDRVAKSGARTGVTFGKVDGIGQFRMRKNDKVGIKGFRIVADPEHAGDVSDGGDSGCVWYRTSDNVGVGLHVGGDITVAEASKRPAIACHLSRVLERFSVQIKEPTSS